MINFKVTAARFELARARAQPGLSRPDLPVLLYAVKRERRRTKPCCPGVSDGPPAGRLSQYRGRELNPHAFQRRRLKTVRLPVTPPRHVDSSSERGIRTPMPEGVAP